MSEQSRKRLRDVLEDRQFKKTLIKRLQRERHEWAKDMSAADEEVCSSREPQHESVETAELTTDSSDWRNVWRSDAYVRDTVAPPKLFEQAILHKLPKPSSVTADDLAEVFFNQLGGISDAAAMESAYDRFVENAILLLDVAVIAKSVAEDNELGWDSHVSEPFPLGRWCLDPQEEPHPDCVHRGILYFGLEGFSKEWTSRVYRLWDSDSESGFMFVVSWNYYDERIVGYLCGDASIRAFAVAEKEFRSIMPSLLNTFLILQHEVGAATRKPDSWWQLPFDARDDFLEVNYPAFTSGAAKEFFRECISGYVGGAKKKGLMERRIANAVRMLMQADSQGNYAVALALCFTAIEAIVCGGNQNISDTLARNAATALEPDRAQRKQAVDAIKNLYDIRSKAVHGEMVEEDEHAWLQTRRLAAGILAAAAQWSAYQRRMGDRLEHHEFVAHLKAASISGSPVVGVSESLRSCLPARN